MLKPSIRIIFPFFIVFVLISCGAGDSSEWNIPGEDGTSPSLSETFTAPPLSLVNSGWCDAAKLQITSDTSADVATNIGNLVGGQWYQITGANADASDLCESAWGNSSITAYSSGAYDSVSDRWLMFGGGHDDYRGNEICAFSFSTFDWSVAADSSTSEILNADCADVSHFSDGKPRSHHTYNSVVFDSYNNALADMNMKAVSGWCPSSSFTNHSFYDFDDGEWTQRTITPAGGGALQLSAEADENGDIWTIDQTTYTFNRHLRRYDESTDTWSSKLTSLSNVAMEEFGTTAIGNGNLVLVGTWGGEPRFNVFDISDPDNPAQTTTYTGSDGWFETRTGGLAYDSRRDIFVGWNGSNTSTVYVLKIDRSAGIHHWTEVAGVGAVVPPAKTGAYPMWKRWIYNQKGDFFVGFLGFSTDPYVYKIGAYSDTSAPVVTSFTVPSQYDTSLDVPITSFTATDNDRVVLYAVTDAPEAPIAWGPGWNTSAPTRFTVSAPGVHTFYAWAMDANGNISAVTTATVEVQTQTISVCEEGCNYSLISEAVAYANANSRQVTENNPGGYAITVEIDAASGPYQIWRGVKDRSPNDPNCGGYLTNNYDHQVGKITASGVTLRGNGGRPVLEYVCTSRTDTVPRWTIYGSSDHGSMIVQATGAHDLRIENLEIVGGTEFNSFNGAGIWVEPDANNLTVIRSIFHDNDNGILTGENMNSTVTILNSQFYNNGAYVGTDGNQHNLYVGSVGKLYFIGNYSASSYRGQLLKSRAAESHVLYNRLSDESDKGLCSIKDTCSNFIIDFSNGGDAQVVGNILYKGDKCNQQDFITYGREVYFTVKFSNGSGEPLTDGTVLTNTRTGSTYTMRYIFNYGSTGAWASNNYAARIDFCSLNSQPTCGGLPEYAMGSGIDDDILAGDTLTFGIDGSIFVDDSGYSWSGGKNTFLMEYNTIVNDCSKGYSQNLIRGIDGGVYMIKNNAILSRSDQPMEMQANPKNFEGESSVGITAQTDGLDEGNNYWLRSPGADFGFVDISNLNYNLTLSAFRLIDYSTRSDNIFGEHDMSLNLSYVHEANVEVRCSANDIGAYGLED